MQVISSGGIPLTLALGVRALRLQRPWLLIAAALVAAWQVSIGFAIGLPVHLSAGAAGRRSAPSSGGGAGRPALDRRMLDRAASPAAAIFVAIVGPHLAALLPGRRRPSRGDAAPLDGRGVLGPLSSLPRSAPTRTWSGATRPAASSTTVNNPVEKTLFPGLVILVLAIVGLALVQPPALAADRARRRGARRSGSSQLGFQEERGLALALPRRLRAAAGLGGDQDARAARRPSRRWRWRCWPGRAPSRALRAARRRLDARGSPAGAGRARGAIAGLAALLALAIVVEGRGLPFDPFDDQDQPRCGRRAALGGRRRRPRSCTCPPRGARTTAATCSGPPTASR